MLAMLARGQSRLRLDLIMQTFLTLAFMHSSVILVFELMCSDMRRWGVIVMRKNAYIVLSLLMTLTTWVPSWAQMPTEGPAFQGQRVQLAQARRPATYNSFGASEGELPIIERTNAWTVGVAGGLLEGTFVRFAAELGKALDDGDNLRVLPIITYGAVGNVNDLLYLRGVDIAITDSDVFEEFKKNTKFGNINKRINYISELYNAEFHVLARPEIKSLKDLEGKKVGFNTKGSAANLTGEIVFKRLGIHVEPIFVNHTIALEKMQTGEFAALVHAVGKPNNIFTKLTKDQGYHFLPVQYDQNLFSDYYLPTALTSADYPTLINPGEDVETIGVPVILAVYNWPKGSDRHRRVERFIKYYFSRFETLRKPPYHPKWQEINLQAAIPGWKRYWVAEELLAKNGQASSSTGGVTDTAAAINPALAETPEDRRLFQEFLEWKKAKKRHQ
jgi:TRAP transporter TAXI family solute receptor